MNYLHSLIFLLILVSISSQEILKKAVVGGGCFWCVQAVLQRLKGVQFVESGYAGGATENPTYKNVRSGNTGHAEVAQVHYNPQIISYHDLIYIFMSTHDPTTLNKQGYDHGTQYRSIILYENEEEKGVIEKVFEELQRYYQNKIVTEVKKLDQFYVAEIQHQNFYDQNPMYGQCQAVIKPKIDKLTQLFSQYVDQAKI